MGNETIRSKKEKLQRLLVQVNGLLDQACATIGNSAEYMETLKILKDNPMKPSDEEFATFRVNDYVVQDLANKITYFLIVKRGLELQLGEIE